MSKDSKTLTLDDQKKVTDSPAPIADKPTSSDMQEPKKDERKINKQDAKTPKTQKRLKKTKRSKRYQDNRQIVDKSKAYSIAEAIELAKKTSNTKFQGSIEVHIRLGIDVKKGDQQVRGAVAMPYGTGKNVNIAAFVDEVKEKEAKEAGADITGGKSLIDKIKQTGKIEFDVAIATPDMMPKLAVIAKILGPKGKMPSPKNQTITTNLKKTIEELKKGKVNFKNDDTGNIHTTIGKTQFETQKLIDNYHTLMNAVKKLKPSTSKGIYIKHISINATMGPGIKVSAS